MARQIGIRWSKSDQQRLKTEIRNYNRRVKYAMSKGLSDLNAPPLLTYGQVRKQIATRRQLTVTIDTLKRATAKTLVAKGRTTIYAQQEQKRQAKRKTQIPIQLSRPLPDVSFERTLGRLPTDRDYLIMQLGLEGRDSYEALTQLDKWLEEGNRSKTIGWKHNYYKRLVDLAAEVPLTADQHEQLERLLNMISKMKTRDFLVGQLLFPEYLQINFIYAASTEEYGFILDTLEQYWGRI